MITETQNMPQNDQGSEHVDNLATGKLTIKVI